MTQAYFYESLTSCPSSAEPSFGSDLQDLLFRLNSAITYSENFDRLSSANLTIYIEVSDVITALPTRRLGTLVSSHLKLNE